MHRKIDEKTEKKDNRYGTTVTYYHAIKIAIINALVQ